MQQLDYRFGPYPTTSAKQPALVGVVGSGNMEVLFEPRELQGHIDFHVETSVSGFDATWQAVLGAFAAKHRLGDLLVTINDAGATPPVVSLRLTQAVEELQSGP